MRDAAGFLICQLCHERIGVYERLGWSTPSGLLDNRDVDSPDPGEAMRPVHIACATGVVGGSDTGAGEGWL